VQLEDIHCCVVKGTLLVMAHVPDAAGLQEKREGHGHRTRKRKYDNKMTCSMSLVRTMLGELTEWSLTGC
jgi:hypothetical protein